MGIHETHAVMLFNVPADTEVAVIEDVMQAVKVLRRIRVRDTREGPTSHTMLVLCECKQTVDATRIPPDMTPDETGEPWTVVVVPAKEPYLMLHPKDLLKSLPSSWWEKESH